MRLPKPAYGQARQAIASCNGDLAPRKFMLGLYHAVLYMHLSRKLWQERKVNSLTESLLYTAIPPLVSEHEIELLDWLLRESISGQEDCHHSLPLIWTCIASYPDVFMIKIACLV